MSLGERQRGTLRSADRVDVVLGAAVGAAVFGVYLATLYPGLIDVGDAAKFAFVGKVLGTPHAPGYPLYVMVSHVFSYVPWGTLIQRMNALSGLLGAFAVVVSYAIARRMGAQRAVACAVALALGFGQSFWATALYAKGYTLNAFLVATGMWCLLRWSDTRRPSDFFWAVGVFALSAGNHLTVIALVPALALFAIATDAKTVLRPKVILSVMALVLAGLCQYWFIVVRTLQGAPYLEAQARTPGELWAVMTARRFAHEIGAFTPSTLFRERIPAVAGLIRTELGLLGLALLAVGIIVLATRQPRRALLFGLGAVGVALLTANMSSAEDRGFLLSAFVLSWAIAGVGLQWVVDVARRRGSAGFGVALLVVMVVSLPVVQLTANYTINDHHGETFETEYFDALFAELPEKTAFVRDEYRYNMMFLYKLLGEDAAGARDIRLVTANRETVEAMLGQGFQVFAFRAGRDRLTEFGFAFDPYVAHTDERVRSLGRRELFRATSAPRCLDIGNLGWTDLGSAAQPKGRLTIRIDNYRAFEARLSLYAAAEQGREPVVVAARGAGVPSVAVDVFPRDDPKARERMAARIREDGATLPTAMSEAPYVIRTEARVNDRGDSATFGVDFGPGVRALLGAALVDQDTPSRASICSHPLAGETGWPSGGPRLTILPDTPAVEFGTGWYQVERREDGLRYRWTEDRAVLVVPIDRPGPMRVVVNAEPLSRPPSEPTLTLVVNGHRLQARGLPPGRSAPEWTVPASALRNGLNEWVLVVDGAGRPSGRGLGADGRMLGVSVTSIDVSMDDPRSP